MLFDWAASILPSGVVNFNYSVWAKRLRLKTAIKEQKDYYSSAFKKILRKKTVTH